MKLVNDAPRYAVTGQDSVHRLQIRVGNRFQLVEILDRGDVRVLFLDFQQDLSAVNGFFFQRGDKAPSKYEEEDDCNRCKAFAQDAPVSAEVDRFFGFDDFIRIGKLDDAMVHKAQSPTPRSWTLREEFEFIWFAHAAVPATSERSKALLVFALLPLLLSKTWPLWRCWVRRRYLWVQASDRAPYLPGFCSSQLASVPVHRFVHRCG